MTTWQGRLVDDLRRTLGDDAVRPYGSFADGGLDGWSDLDVELRLSGDTDAETLFGAPLWAWQDHRTAQQDTPVQTVRAVLADGRRVDATVRGAALVLPEAPADLAIRFDAALALTRIGRGADLIGLHLVLGVLRETLVLGMLLADRDTGSDHHRSATEHDTLAARVADVAGGPVDLALVTAACALHGSTRTLLDPDHRPDWSGLAAVTRLAVAHDPAT